MDNPCVVPGKNIAEEVDVVLRTDATDLGAPTKSVPGLAGTINEREVLEWQLIWLGYVKGFYSTRIKLEQIHLKRKAPKITEGPIFGVIFGEKEQPVAAAI